jgi:hypothetical protein
MASIRRLQHEVQVGGMDQRRDGFFDPWQNNAIEALRHHRLWAVSAPTGSGKSVVQAALLSLHPNKNLWIAPQSVILSSISKPVNLQLASGECITWRSHPELRFIEEGRVGERLVNFLTSTTTGSVTAVCTTPSANTLFRTLRNTDRLGLLTDVGTAWDEGHHSENDPQNINRTGETIQWLVEHGRGPVGASTATWFRTNLNEMLPRGGQDFSWFTYPMHRYLANMRYLRNIEIGFLIGTPEQALDAMLCESMARTMVHIPPPNSRYAEGTKEEQLARLLQVCGPSVQEGAFRRHTRRIDGRIRNLRTSDLVTIGGRDGEGGRKRAHMQALSGHPPDVTFALYLGMEGYDDPGLQRGLLIGARNSPITRLQCLGRLLRDCAGKTWVQFWIVVPPLVNRADAATYLTDIIGQMADMEWRIRPALLNYDVRPEDVDNGTEEDDSFNMGEAVRDLIGEHLRHPSANLDEIARRVVRDQGVVDEQAYAEELLDRVRRLARAISADELPGVPLVEGVLGNLERLSVELTSSTLLQMRARCGWELNITRNDIMTAIQRYYEETGRWPNRNRSEPVPELPEVTWLQMHGAACRLGESLDLLVDEVHELLRPQERRRHTSG